MGLSKCHNCILKDRFSERNSVDVFGLQSAKMKFMTNDDIPRKKIPARFVAISDCQG